MNLASILIKMDTSSQTGNKAYSESATLFIIVIILVVIVVIVYAVSLWHTGDSHKHPLSPISGRILNMPL